MNLIIIRKDELNGPVATLEDHRAAHIHAILKTEKGHDVRVGLLEGPFGTGKVLETSRSRVVLECSFGAEVPSRSDVSVILGLPRPRAMERLWPVLSALGVDKIVLTNANKVERMYFDTHIVERPAREEMLIEGLQQARDTRLPEVHVFKRLKFFLEDQLDAMFPDQARIFADPSATDGVRHAVERAGKRRVVVAVGPEGGWTDYERDVFVARGFVPAGLGPRTLRTDVACIALLTLVHEALAGLGGEG